MRLLGCLHLGTAPLFLVNINITVTTVSSIEQNYEELYLTMKKCVKMPKRANVAQKSTMFFISKNDLFWNTERSFKMPSRIFGILDDTFIPHTILVSGRVSNGRATVTNIMIVCQSNKSSCFSSISQIFGSFISGSYSAGPCRIIPFINKDKHF